MAEEDAAGLGALSGRYAPAFLAASSAQAQPGGVSPAGGRRLIPPPVPEAASRAGTSAAEGGTHVPAPPAELFRALGCLSEPPTSGTSELADLLELGEAPHEAEYADLFVFQLYPYASVYLGPEGMLGGEARDRIAGFWRALRLEPPNEPDHLAVLLSFYAGLCEAERAAAPAETGAWTRARQAFLWEHLWSWLDIYLARVGELASPFYRRWAEILRNALAAETGLPGPPRLPLHLREAAPVSDPRRQGLKPFLQSLLSPARSGMILVRQDLVRAGRALELGVRAGERRFALEFLLAQDAPGMLAWLAAEADRQAGGPRGEDPVSGFWRERARATARLLQALAGEAA